jgi:hypothetical protein
VSNYDFDSTWRCVVCGGKLDDPILGYDSVHRIHRDGGYRDPKMRHWQSTDPYKDENEYLLGYRTQLEKGFSAEYHRSKFYHMGAADAKADVELMTSETKG